MKCKNGKSRHAFYTIYNDSGHNKSVNTCFSRLTQSTITILLKKTRGNCLPAVRKKHKNLNIT